ncbi:MAG: hypothetical protein BWY09_02887 [Candidatus Hydrogenedentes bacterium ADurb.Bin179]|nr:MAG: hypothetical protein BWY09_02887 [Candidatus Hydrogenedentes bacterium ADurb.Bin179]
MFFIAVFYDEHAVWILPVFIFLSRILDVSIGTLRLVFLGRGMRLLAPLCGFFEVLVWLVAVSRVMGDLNSWVNYIAYAGGFAAGNYVGMYIEQRLAMGLLSVMIITPSDAALLLQKFAQENFGVTQVGAQGAQGKVCMIYLIIKRKDLLRVSEMLETDQPDAFVVVNDVRAVAGGVFPLKTARSKGLQRLFKGARKGK